MSHLSMGSHRCCYIIYTIFVQPAKFLSSFLFRDKSQIDRIAALEEFKSGRIPLLIATDVAARGLDIPQVEYVLNYSFPLTVEDYVHRIGRTGYVFSS
jgi:ATP-dependent RNA helicase DBP3